MTNEEACLELLQLKFYADTPEKAERIRETIKMAITALRSHREWIPFKTRELEAEEKKEHPEWEYVLCGHLPKDGQKILVSVKKWAAGYEAVRQDEFYTDSDGCCLDSEYEIGKEATAWMPLPEPYRGGDADD